MATRSLIGKLNLDGTITNIYCHFDGYPEHNGVILQEHYYTPFKVDQLLALGNLSVLSEQIGEKQDFDSYSTRNNDWCLAYGRDRGESNQQATVSTHEEFFSDDHGVDYLYLYNNEFEWECYSAWDLSSVTIPTAATA
jgi:hypothetical protein